jgi:hypothetical protein
MCACVCVSGLSAHLSPLFTLVFMCLLRGCAVLCVCMDMGWLIFDLTLSLETLQTTVPSDNHPMGGTVDYQVDYQLCPKHRVFLLGGFVEGEESGWVMFRSRLLTTLLRPGRVGPPRSAWKSSRFLACARNRALCIGLLCWGVGEGGEGA